MFWSKQVPWNRLGKDPVIVLLDRIFILAEPLKDDRTFTVSICMCLTLVPLRCLINLNVWEMLKHYQLENIFFYRITNSRVSCYSFIVLVLNCANSDEGWCVLDYAERR